MARMRWLMPSKSMLTETASFFATSAVGAVPFGALADFASFALSGDFSADLSPEVVASGPFSSSLSGPSGEGRSLRRTMTYTLRVTSLPSVDMSRPPIVGHVRARDEEDVFAAGVEH